MPFPLMCKPIILLVLNRILTLYASQGKTWQLTLPDFIGNTRFPWSLKPELIRLWFLW